MVTPTPQSRYVEGTEGAPPLPPPGGYRAGRGGPRRAPATPVAGSVPPAAPAAKAARAPRPRASLAAKIILGVAIAHALGLAAYVWFGRGSSYFLSLNAVVLQLVVLAAVIVVLLSARGRRLGTIALVITLLLNTATLGGVRAVVAAQTGDYSDFKSSDQRYWEAYPGLRDVPPSELLSQPSMESLRERSTAIMADLRERISAEFGVTWVRSGDEGQRNKRNGYGGESMAVDWTSETWSTVEPFRNLEDKRRLMALVSEVFVSHGFRYPVALNTGGGVFTPDILTKMFGAAEPENQHSWSTYSEYPGSNLGFYVDIDDLSRDPTGQFRAEREALAERYGKPLEGITLMGRAWSVLSEERLPEFRAAMENYRSS